ncbi:progestin and adipoQ receptor family member 4-like isoform X2 [Limulus polyphemus]|uniref:Progestin and adipoQ receptor family member 4-like isoform X2 n=1 Tax=Limulus polyphemus TaxID=6850 RepID=A0ABM1SVC6_LIMPO|nr:progestin and adipoQ receptor family member 4-like isoform X2 [Limulus polyphemus]
MNYLFYCGTGSYNKRPNGFPEALTVDLIPATRKGNPTFGNKTIFWKTACNVRKLRSNFKEKFSNFSEANDQSLLLRRDQSPIYLQFNPYIFKGYRPILTTWGCIRSLFYLHNETVNIVTHALALMYALICLPTLLPWHQIQIPVLPYCHVVATFAPWLGSFIYHLFMNHEGGCKTYMKLLKWDIIGIWITQTCGAFTTIYAGTACLPLLLCYGVRFMYLMFCMKALFAATFASSAWQRRTSFLFLLLMRLFVLCIRLTTFGGGHSQALVHVIMQEMWSVTGAVISATHVPERWLPGKLDIVFNSHNIMHVLVIFGVMHMHWAVEKDFTWLSEGGCIP